MSNQQNQNQKKKKTKEEYNSDIDWNKMASTKGPDRPRVAGEEVLKLDYISISDCLMNRDRGGGMVLEQAAFKYGVSKGKRQPSELGRYRIKPLREFAVDSSFSYKPGDVIEWKRQLYNRESYGLQKGAGSKKLTQEKIDDMVRRGDGDQVSDYGSAIVDEHGLITVTYQDAAQMISNNGYITAFERGKKRKYGICSLSEFSSRQVRHEVEPKIFKTQTKNHWLFEEIPPWEDPANKD